MYTDTDNQRRRSAGQPRRGERHHLDRIAEANLYRHGTTPVATQQPEPNNRRHHLEHLAEANPGRRRPRDRRSPA
ncbi:MULTISPECIES: hypothetical protein [unclassified Nocardia]|uniref:hypothetical protein n=1 Tax=unclassified Nocardia TaxID=2637762 RepID=UPI001CE45888|nr:MULTISPECIES: hypothetical protein [unclassified Nocardia]